MTAALPASRPAHADAVALGRHEAVVDMVAGNVARARAHLAAGDVESADLQLAWAEEAIAQVRPALRRRPKPTVVPFPQRRSA